MNIVGGKQADCGCIVRFVHGKCQKIKCQEHLKVTKMSWAS